MSATALPATDVAAIKETFEAFSRCLVEGDFDRWVSYWAEDGVLMPQDHPRVVGPSALVEYMRSNFDAVGSIKLTDWSFYGAGNLAIASNNVQWTDADGQLAPAMKQVIVLAKDAAGKWHLKTVIFNSGV